MNLIILSEDDRQGDSFVFSDVRAEHIRTVLKSNSGDTVEVGLINGGRGTAIIESVQANEVILKIDQLTDVADPEPHIDLIVALPRPQTLKKVLWTAGSMGVRSLHLIRANRVEKSYYDSPLLEPENYKRFLIDGMSQGKQTRLTEVQIHNRFKPFFEDFLPEYESKKTPGVKLVCDMDTDVSLKKYLNKNPDRLLIAVGPEGGWVPFETELMISSGFQPFSLGRWVLRVESAVTAALAAVEQAILEKVI